MGTYINNALVEGEEIIHEACYSKKIWLWPVILFNILITLPAYLAEPPLLILILPISLLLFIYTYLRVHTDEFAVTSQRLFIKTGVISRSTTEISLSKIEVVYVNQGIIDRAYGCGTIVCRGTGSTYACLSNISDPHEFRKALQTAQERCSRTDTSDREPTAIACNGSQTEKTENAKEPLSLHDKVEKLTQLKGLLDSGILTQEEFDREKAKILNQ
ncbi:MAG: PH domain-containing protein [Prevotella sp.]|nr:PH domain-containing protein [Prevotella sp.]